MELTVIRGDSYNLTFSLLKGNGNVLILSERDKCYFTVKKQFEHEDCVIQKRYGTGIEYNEEKKVYSIKLNPCDTCDLKCGNYKFDIKVKLGDEIVKTLLRGTLILTNNATHRCNE